MRSLSIPNPDHDRLREAIQFIDVYVAEQQRIKAVPGVAVAIRHAEETMFSSAYGFADTETQEPLTAQHIFRVASHSKMFTATVIMQLVEAGKLRLDDRIESHVKGMAPEVGRITLRQVLNHSGGIIRDGEDANYWQLEHAFPDVSGLRRLSKAILDPNETFKYSNIGYSLLGLVIESAAAVPYNDYVRESILAPLGLMSTGPDSPLRESGRLVTGYTGLQFPFARVAIPDIQTGAMSPATGFYSTAVDLTRFAAAHFFGNDELLSDASKREMQQPYWEIKGAEEHYGLGLAVTKVGERRIVGHSGGFPGHSTRTWFDPKAHLAVAVMTNETGGPSSTIAKSIMNILDTAMKVSRASQSSSRLDPRTFTGRFANLWGVTNIVAFGDTLYELAPSEDDPMAEPTELEILDKDTLRITKTSGYGSPTEMIHYLRNAAGQVTQIVNAGSNFYPPEVYEERIQGGLSAPITPWTVPPG